MGAVRAKMQGKSPYEKSWTEIRRGHNYRSSRVMKLLVGNASFWFPY